MCQYAIRKWNNSIKITENIISQKISCRRIVASCFQNAATIKMAAGYLITFHSGKGELAPLKKGAEWSNSILSVGGANFRARIFYYIIAKLK